MVHSAAGRLDNVTEAWNLEERLLKLDRWWYRMCRTLASRGGMCVVLGGGCCIYILTDLSRVFYITKNIQETKKSGNLACTSTSGFAGFLVWGWDLSFHIIWAVLAPAF